MKLEELKKEYANQDNRATAYPIYITVQELRFIGVLEENYSPNCPFGGAEIRMKHDCDNCEEYPCFDENKLENEPDHCPYDIRCGYVWIPVEFFLTIKGAREYIQANKHNHGRLRTYVNHFERRNYEMRNFLKDTGFKIND